jgi:low temperature requirement protein LtrA
MVAGIVLLALGLKKTLGHVGDPLHAIPAAALMGGAALYLIAHVLFRIRHVHSLSRQRLAAALVCLALIPAALALPALASLALLAVVLVTLIAYEALRFAAARDRVRHQLTAEPQPD